MTGISATIITFNEAHNIADCIRSVCDWCDEVIILDSFSTDQTKEIAATFPKVQFHTHAFDGHIQQKNRAIGLAKGPWIFALDADERVSPELSQEILRFIQSNPDQAGARVKRLTWHLGRFIRHGGWYNARYRLFKKNSARWAGENPHDFILLEGKSRPTSGPVLKGDLIHYSFRDLSHQVDTINKFSSIVAFARFQKKKSASILNMLVKPFGKFIECYFFKSGWLDGFAGFVIAVSSAYSTFLKFAKLYELQELKLHRPSNLGKDYADASNPL
ncbi:MAG: glycosyltransferase family 2 protein [Leptospiraceae bacterium]|nr:glycosyltransferase family 2 protein [Leptospiraceae bacterium]